MLFAIVIVTRGSFGDQQEAAELPVLGKDISSMFALLHFLPMFISNTILSGIAFFAKNLSLFLVAI